MTWPLWRSTGDHIARLRALFRPAPPPPPPLSAIVQVEPAENQPIRVSANFSEHRVRVDVDRLGHFTLSRRTAFSFAKQVEGAADALGPEPPAPAEGIDITDEVEGKEGEGG